MDYRAHSGITYEITTLALAHEPGFSVELSDLTGGGGVVAEVRVRGGIVTLVHQAPLPAVIYSWWASAVELEASQRGAQPDV